jgi:hypothetical protein
MSDTNRPVKFTSPKGVAVYPWLDKADTKWKPEGEYRIKLRIPEEAALKLIEKLQPLFEKSLADAHAKFAANPKNKGKKAKIVEQEYYTKVTDDDGDETGEYEFNFKRTASGVSKKTNKPWAIKPDLFDAAGRPLAADVKVYGGSVCKVSFEVIPYDTPKATGIKLSLCAVQVIKLVEGSGRSAGQYGFNDESDDEDAEGEGFGGDEGTTSDGDEGGSGDAF